MYIGDQKNGLDMSPGCDLGAIPNRLMQREVGRWVWSSRLGGCGQGNRESSSVYETGISATSVTVCWRGFVHGSKST
jgi:hypothetical protein